MKFLEGLAHYISISNSPSAIDAQAVFQPDFPAEAWAKMFREINLDQEHQKSLTRLVNMVLGKPLEERRRLTEIVCKPKLKIFIKRGADKELKGYEISRQMIAYTLSCSDENLRNIKQALDQAS